MTDTAHRPIASIAQVTGLGAALDARTGILASVRSLLGSGLSAAIQVIGDSTGDSTTEWPYLLGGLLAADYPNHTVRYRAWNDTTQDYDAPVVLQSGPLGTRHMVLPGGSPNYLVVPDDAVNSVKGSIDVRWYGVFDSVPLGGIYLVSKSDGLAGQRSYSFYFHTGGTLRLDWYPDGVTLNLKISTATPTITAGVPVGLRATLNTATGQVTFYTSADGQTWAQLGNLPAAGGATAIFDSTSNVIVGLGNTLVGKIYEVDIRDGINGSSCIPRNLDEWQIQSTTATLGGSPILDIINGSRFGADFAYHSASTARVNAMLPLFGQSVVLVSNGHNESIKTPSIFLGAYKTYLASIRERLPLAGVGVIAQNEQAPPASYRFYHNRRLAFLAPWAVANGCKHVDVSHAFRGGIGLIGTDGVHPTASGSALWANFIHAQIMGGA